MGLAVAALALPATALALKLRHGAHAQAAQVAHVPTAHRFKGVSKIGPLYRNARATRHECTASVVDTRAGDTLITAAHCVAGSGAGMVFVPGQTATRAPFGRWTVTAVRLDPKWISRQDPDDDVAFLTVAPRIINGRQTTIEHVTGAYKLGLTATRGERVTVSGYPGGSPNNPITCVTKTYLTREFPSFDCRGFVGGTSGSPWLKATSHGTEIVGVIGGLHQGGCVDHTSYSSPLARDAQRAYVRASDHDPADTAPARGSDGC